MTMKAIRIFVILLMCLSAVELQAQKKSTELSEEDRIALEGNVEDRINDFLSYLPEIAAKSDKSMDERNLARQYIKLALAVFIGEGEKYPYIDNNGNERMHDAVKMQTTSNRIKNNPIPMKRYLNRLMGLPYQKVEIDTCEAVRINKKLHETSDGRYVGSAIFVQAFRAWKDGRLVIDDTDAKQVTIYVERIKLNENSSVDSYVWDVKLGDIRITTDWN